MTEKARKIFDILGVGPGEEFKVSDSNFRYSFNHNLGLEFYNGAEWRDVENIDTYRKILNGEMKIIKIPKPTEEDKIVIAYAKLCGCKWVAKDKSGGVCAFTDRPYKEDDYWNQDEDKFVELMHNISFLSWEDEEPYYIGE